MPNYWRAKPQRKPCKMTFISDTDMVYFYEFSEDGKQALISFHRNTPRWVAVSQGFIVFTMADWRPGVAEYLPFEDFWDVTDFLPDPGYGEDD